MEPRLFKNGIPTDTDVKRLRAAYPDELLSPGTIIGYEDVEKILNKDRRSYRFKTVTDRWRKLLEEESGIIIIARKGLEFKVCDNSDKLQLSTNKAKSSIRMARRSKQIGSKIDRNALTEDEKKRFDITIRFTAAVTGLQDVRCTVELPTL